MRAELDRRLAVLVEPVARAVLDGVHELEGDPDRIRVELGVVPVFVDERPLIGLAGLLDWRGSGRLSAVVRSSFFRGAAGEQLLTLGERRWPVDRLVLVGLGSRAEFDEARARAFGSRCVKIATGLGAESVLIALPSGSIERGLVERAFDALLEAISARGAERGADQPPPDAEPEPGAADLVEAADPPEPTPADESETAPESQSPAAAAAEVEDEPAAEVEDRPQTGERGPQRPEPRWWVVADESVVARLRRVRSGPPRAARGGPGLYT